MESDLTVTPFCRLLLPLLMIQTSGCGATEEASDLFASEEAAFAFTRSLGTDWAEPFGKLDGHKFNELDVTFYSFRLGDQTGRMALGFDADQRLSLYEVRFPIVDEMCVGTPDPQRLARILLDHTEPAAAEDARNVRLLASIANMVWPYTAFRSGPGARFGKTDFTFYKMNGYCSFQALRVWDRV